MKGRHHKKQTMKEFKFEMAFAYHLSNEYYTELLSKIFNTVDTITIDIDHVNRAIENARRHKEILNKYLFAPTWSESTELIKTMNEERRGMLTSMRTGIISSKRAETEEKREAAKVLVQWIKPHRKNISSRNVENEMYAIWGLEHPYDTDPRISEALKVLSLDERFKAILSHQEKLIKLEIAREKAKQDNEHKAKERRRACQRDLKMMLDTLYSVVVLYPDENEEVYKVCQIIEGIIKDAHKIHRFRKTINKKRKARAANLLLAKGKRTKKELPKSKDKKKEKPEEKQDNNQEIKPEEKQNIKDKTGESTNANQKRTPKEKQEESPKNNKETKLIDNPEKKGKQAPPPSANANDEN